MQHSHSAGCHCDADDGEKFSLYRFINLPGLRGLNAANDCRRVFRPGVVGGEELFGSFLLFLSEHEKTKTELFVESEDEDELILIVPFTGSVRLRKIVFGAAGDACPTECRIFKNVDVSFDNCHDTQPTQTLKLGEDPGAELELAVLAPKFNDCRTLTLFFPASKGGDKVVSYFLGVFFC
jgi:hypothetical protein